MRLRDALLAALLAGAGCCACAQTGAPSAAASTAASAAAAASSAAPAAASSAPSRQQVQQALERVRADPLLGHDTTHRRLRFKPKKEKELPELHGNWDWLFDLLQWVANLGRWVARFMRWLIWALGAGLVVFLLLRLRRWLRLRGAAAGGAGAALPSHVQSLDIRPESLPDDIGSAAAALWQRGEQRAALSLLYRGALSRLVHVHALPIRAASTEGECLALAWDRLDASRAAFFARLVNLWLPAVYGARMPEAGQALGLCREFDQQFTAPAAGGAA